MLRYIVRRLVQMIPLLIGVSIIVFLLGQLAPGDPVRLLLGEEATAEDVARLNAIYGSDQPLPVQYFRWFIRAIQGDLGVSIRQTIPVSTLIFERLGATLELAIFSVLIAVLLGIPVGSLCRHPAGLTLGLCEHDSIPHRGVHAWVLARSCAPVLRCPARTFGCPCSAVMLRFSRVCGFCLPSSSQTFSSLGCAIYCFPPLLWA